MHEKVWERIVEDAYFRQIFDCLYEAVSILDADGRVMVWNKSAEMLYRIPAQDIIGKNVSVHLPEALIAQAGKERTPIKNVVHSPRKGTHIVMNAMPFYVSGQYVGVVCSDRDYSEVVELNAALEKAKSKIHFLEKKVKKDADKFGTMIASSPAVLKLIGTAQQIAPTNTNVMITGESGTGKEIFAQGIHDYSDREGLFVPVNCSAIPAELFESEFFGYEPGAFTGASRKGKAGFFEIANRGTLFLDEIGDLSLPMQAKLLRVLQEQEIYRVGGERRTKLDVRVISATNKPLRDMVVRHEFREDLYYRLNVVDLKLPALRERKDDIPLLIDHYIRHYGQKHSRNVRGADKLVMDFFREYRWPGNIRELMNVMESMVVTASGTVLTEQDIPSYFFEKPAIREQMPSTLNLHEAVGNLEQTTIRRSLELCRHKKTEAAKLLGIPRATLYAKLKQYGMDE